MNENPLTVTANSVTGLIESVTLYGRELLDQTAGGAVELRVNGAPLKTRLYPTPGTEGLAEPHTMRLKGERFTDHFSGWGLVIARAMGERAYAKYPCYGVHHLIRRELADMIDLPCPGPGGPVVEAPLFVDTFSLMNWNWKFWGDDTRMIFPSLHSSGPVDEFGHVGYENDTPETAKKFMKNVWRRIYPGVMAIHGGLFYNANTGHWIAITCRRPNVGYILNIEDAGRGVGYDFTLHAPFNIGDSLQMPEVKIYFGETTESMWAWAADYITAYYEEPPAWTFKAVFMPGLAWTNKPTWTDQAIDWESRLNAGLGNAVNYSLVTNRPIKSGTTPIGYDPDPNHGTTAEFKAMGRRLADRGVPYTVWMSHTGMNANNVELDDDWFIRGVDGRMSASWGSVDGGMMHVNPGHPGYIEYTKKWIRFYMRECGAKGIFFDCLGWAFPPDYRPRSFMRFPGDTNRMAIRFMEEVYACIKECDPDGIMLGEGTTLDAPVNVFSINTNPKRAVDGLGPRDFFLSLNQWSKKRIVVDQGPTYAPAAGYIRLDERPGSEERNRALMQLVAAHGGRDSFVALPGDLSLMPSENLLIVPAPIDVANWSKEESELSVHPDFQLPAPINSAAALEDTITSVRFEPDSCGRFSGVPTGIYHIV